MAAKKKDKKADPISDRARALNEQIAALQTEIKKLDTQIQRGPSPRLRSTTLPHGATLPHAPETPAPPPPPVAREPIFEEIKSLKSRVEAETPEHFNELGARKYDLPALIQRLRNFFQGPSASNSRLVTYLAAGGVRGLRPLRYEKRVARNRVIALAIIFFLILLGVISLFVRNL
jgi:hypothetical protein